MYLLSSLHFQNVFELPDFIISSYENIWNQVEHQQLVEVEGIICEQKASANFCPTGDQSLHMTSGWPLLN